MSDDPKSREAMVAKAREYRDHSGQECDRWHRLRAVHPYKGGGSEAEKAFAQALEVFRASLPKETDFSGEGRIPDACEKFPYPRVEVRYDVLLGIQAELQEMRWRYLQAEAIAREWELGYLELADRLKQDK